MVLVVRLAAGAMPPTGVLLERLGAAADAFPLMASRLKGPWWMPAPGPGISIVGDGPPLSFAPLQPFALHQEAPVRVVASPSGEWLLLCAHHFAFDGLGMVALVRWLLTGERSAPPDYTKPHSSPPRPPLERLQHIFAAADRVAPSETRPDGETFLARHVQLSGPRVTARLAKACVTAIVAHNAAHKKPIRRIGLSVAVGGVDGESATYRRLDLLPNEDIEEAVAVSLADRRVPPELLNLPPGAFLLRPILWRFSDTLLVSNLGRLDLPGAIDAEIYPVARGRSAAAFGATAIPGHPTTLTFRVRDLSPEDAARVLARVVDEVENGA